MTLNTLAKKLKITPQILLKEGILAYLEKKLNDVSIEMEEIKRKWQVKSVKDFDKKIRTGKIHEFSKNQDVNEDFFRLSYLEEEREKFLQLLREYEK